MNNVHFSARAPCQGTGTKSEQGLNVAKTDQVPLQGLVLVQKSHTIPLAQTLNFGRICVCIRSRNSLLFSEIFKFTTPEITFMMLLLSSFILTTILQTAGKQMVGIYRAAKWRGKYQPLFTDTEVNNCLTKYVTIEKSIPNTCSNSIF